MGYIDARSASIATIYATAVVALVSCVFGFSGISDNRGNMGIGLTYIFFTTISMLAGLTSPHKNDSLLRAVCVCVSAVWCSKGMYHLMYSYSSLTSVEPVDRLFPGYVVSTLIFLVLSITTHFQHAKTTAIISFIMTLTLSFDIASLWRDLSKGSAACNIILAAILLYVSAKTLFQKYNKPNPKSKTESFFSHDYMTVGYVASALSFGIFAIGVLGVSAAPRHSFMWVTSSGILYFLSAIAALRRNDSVSGGYFSLLGAFWLAISYNLSLSGNAAFASFYINGVVPSLAVYIFFIICFLCFSMISIRRQLFQSFHSFIMSLFCVSFCVDGLEGTFIGTVCWVGLVLSLYGLAAYSLSANTMSGDYRIPLGDSVFQTQTMMNFMSTRSPMFRKLFYGKLKGSSETELFSTDTMLGYAKYGDFDMLGFGANAIAALSIIFVSGGDAIFTVPWVLGLGGIVQFWVGSIGFARGKTFESCSFMIFSIFWSTWGTVRAMNLIPTAASTGMYVGCVCFLIVGVLMMFIASVTNKAWVVLTFFFNLLILSFMLQCLNVTNTDLYETVIVIVFSLVCLYMFTASALKAIWQRDVIPLGSPLLQVNYLHSQGTECTWADARKAGGVKIIADIINRGGIVAIPTDTVYVLASPIKFPDAVLRAYNSKKLAEDRPMSIWISNVKQIEAARESMGETCWAFLQQAWPSSMSMVIDKGAWVEKLGMGFADKYIGTPDSIAFRMPDNTATLHLIDQTGPLAISSANPTGEPDTTHHLQSFARLGIRNCDGVLCNGPSVENAPSSVVDCRNIDEGKLGFFRIGVTPKSVAESILERVLEEQKSQHKKVLVTIRHSASLANVLSIKRKKRRELTESSFQDGSDDFGKDSRESIKSTVETSFISEHEYVTKLTSNTSEHSPVGKTTSRSNSHSAVAKMVSYVKEITGNTSEINENACSETKNPIYIESDEEDDKKLFSRNSKRKTKENNRIDGEDTDM